jgi:hypothetical protein
MPLEPPPCGMSTNEAFAGRLRELVSENRRPTSEDLTERYWVKEAFTGQLFHRLAATASTRFSG